MQSPLMPQRGRIESNPREYTHMGPRFCSELKAIPADWVKAPRDRRASVEIRTPAERAWTFGRNRPPKAQKPSKYPRSFGGRPIIHARVVLSAEPLSRTFARAPHSAISRTAYRNLRQSSCNSPMCIAHDDDIGARDWGRIHGRAADNAGD